MSSQARDAAIVGIHEYPSRDVEGRLSPLQIKAESAARALEDVGLSWSDVDAIYDAGEGGGMAGLSIAEYFGLKPNIIDTTNVGGSSYEYHAAHAKRDIASGKAKVACSATRRISALSASSSPPPQQIPLMAAITGLFSARNSCSPPKPPTP